MRIIKLGVISLAAVGMSACTTITDKYGFCKDATKCYQSAPPLERAVVLPQNLNPGEVQDYYEVPQTPAEAGNAPPPITPPGSRFVVAKGQPQSPQAVMLSQQDRIRNAESAKIQGHTSSAANVPAAVSASYPQAWVKVGHVLQAANYKIVEKDKVLGTYYVIDTRSTGGKLKKDMPIYQVNLKPSGNGTVVTVSPGNAALQDQINRSLND